jgi:hypothetical protein
MTYVEVVARVREVLKWMDPREMVELKERYDVGSRQKNLDKENSYQVRGGLGGIPKDGSRVTRQVSQVICYKGQN